MILKKDKPNFKCGEYIRKVNFILFGGQFPYIKVTNYLKRNGVWVINGKYQVKDNSVVSCPDAERHRLYYCFEESRFLSKPNSEERVCSLENGDPKIRYSLQSFRRALFSMKAKYTDKKFNAYRCPNCDGIHIGKIKE